MALTGGTKLGGYEVLTLIGAGGMGEVYRARDPVLKRDVAIKILPSSVSQDSDRLRRFQQEAQAAAALSHPNILAVYHFGTFEGSCYLVSELLEGNTLRQLIERGQIPIRKVVDYAVQIANGLAAAHEQGIVHRDLKPENLFVTKAGSIRILDFGLAKLTQRDSVDDDTAPVTQQTEAGLVMGTVGYMSPEQVRGANVDHRCDIFAFGVILYEMLTGNRAFRKPTAADTMSAILNEDPPNISQLTPVVSPALRRVVQHCLEKNASQRFRSASDLAFALEALSDSGTNPTVPKAQPSRRLAWRWFAVSGIALAVVAVVLVWWSTPPPTPFVEEVTQLTNDGQPKGGPVVTDGSRVYFTEGPSGSGKLAQVSIAGGATVPVETPFASAGLVGIAPDSSSLLVGAKNHLWSVPVPGGEPHRLDLEQQMGNATYFPDGRILFSDQSGLYVAEGDGSKPRRIVSQGGIGSPAVSSDGKSIAFDVTPSMSANPVLFQSASDGTALRPVAKYSDYTWSCCAVWSPDGRSLLFQGGQSSTDLLNADLWWSPAGTRWFRRSQKAVRLTNGEPSWEQTGTPAMSRDGREIFAVGAKWRGELVRYDMKSQLFVPFLSGISAVDPTFSPDGKWVAWESYPDHALWRSRIDGTDRMQLTHAPLYATWHFISPDGKRVVFATPDYQIYLVGMDGDPPQRIVEKTAFAASWSPDGNLLAVTFSLPDKPNDVFELGIYDLRTGKTIPVPSSQGMNGAGWITQDILVAEKSWNRICNL